MTLEINVYIQNFEQDTQAPLLSRTFIQATSLRYLKLVAFCSSAGFSRSFFISSNSMDMGTHISPGCLRWNSLIPFNLNKYKIIYLTGKISRNLQKLKVIQLSRNIQEASRVLNSISAFFSYRQRPCLSAENQIIRINYTNELYLVFSLLCACDYFLTQLTRQMSSLTM